MRRILVALVFVPAAFAVVAGPAAACPMCKNAGEDGDKPAGNQPGAGYFWSILTMLGTMGLVATGLIRLMVKASRGVSDLPPEAGESSSDSRPRP